jgi:hypothetical protein
MPSETLWDLLPQIWKRLDKEGILEDFLAVLDEKYGDIGDEIVELLLSRNIDKIRDRSIQFKLDTVGEEFRASAQQGIENIPYNRSRASTAISRHSYKGTWARLDDVLTRLGVTDWDTIDNNEILLVPGCNGLWGHDDCFWADDDFYHPGARHLIVRDNLTEAPIRAELDQVTAVGEKWFITIDVPN